MKPHQAATPPQRGRLTAGEKSDHPPARQPEPVRNLCSLWTPLRVKLERYPPTAKASTTTTGRRRQQRTTRQRQTTRGGEQRRPAATPEGEASGTNPRLWTSSTPQTLCCASTRVGMSRLAREDRSLTGVSATEGRFSSAGLVPRGPLPLERLAAAAAALSEVATLESGRGGFEFSAHVFFSSTRVP